MKGLPKGKSSYFGPKMKKLARKKKSFGVAKMAKEDTYQNSVKES